MGIDKMQHKGYYRQEFLESILMAHKYEVGHKVVITPAKDGPPSTREYGIEAYVGKSGEVIDYYWIDRGTAVFYIYVVRVEDGNKEIVLHEDELQPHIG